MPFARRSIAMLAAYVVALQMLLLPLTVAAGSVISGVHCTADQPVQHGTQGCSCAAGCGSGCCAQALTGPPAADATLVVPRTAPEPPPIGAGKGAWPAHRVMHSARGPPAAGRT